MNTTQTRLDRLDVRYEPMPVAEVPGPEPVRVSSSWGAVKRLYDPDPPPRPDD